MRVSLGTKVAERGRELLPEIARLLKSKSHQGKYQGQENSKEGKMCAARFAGRGAEDELHGHCYKQPECRVENGDGFRETGRDG